MKKFVGLVFAATVLVICLNFVSAQVGPTCCPASDPCENIICGRNKQCIPHPNRCSYYCVTVSCPNHLNCKQPACDGNPCAPHLNCINDCPSSCLHACEVPRSYTCRGK
uniref:Uncharacterized protein n=1 Tax=Clytia hemisphaerica TaxID=252671 RepID=A0A7M5UPP1_9CNID